MSTAARTDLLRSARLLAGLFLLGLVLRAFVSGIYAVPSASMLPGIRPGDYLLVLKWPYGWSRYALPGTPPLPAGRVRGRRPQRGDVVLVRAPVREVDYVKRVIGLPGDRVALDGGGVVLNDRPISRLRVGDFVLPATLGAPCPDGHVTTGGCRYRRYRETLPGGISYPVLDTGPGPADDRAAVAVPANHIFLRGDDRDESADSRIAPTAGGLGLVDTDRLIGRASIVIWSSAGTARLRDPASWAGTIRWDRIGLRP